MDKSTLKTEINKNICLFIIDKFFTPFKIDYKEVSLNKYARATEIAPSTISKINEGIGYEIPFNMIYLILKFEKVSLEDFFNEFENKYGKASE